MGLRLYDIGIALEQLEQQLEESGGELTPELEQQLEQLMTQRDEAIGKMVQLIRNWQGEAEIFRVEAQRLTARARSLEAREERLREFIGKFLRRDEVLKFQTASVGWRRSERVEVSGDLPEQYQRVIREANKTLIRQTIKEGGEVPGARIAEHYEVVVK